LNLHHTPVYTPKDDGHVLDGWHRYQVCQVLGIPPRTKPLPQGMDPLAFVKSYNLHRRSLSASQRAVAIVACREWANSGDNQHTKRGGEVAAPPQSVLEMAKEAEVSRRTIQQAKRAIEGGLGDQVRDGKLSAEKAAKIVTPLISPRRSPQAIVYPLRTVRSP